MLFEDAERLSSEHEHGADPSGPCSLLGLYLRDIHRYHRLEAEEEQRLFSELEAGCSNAREELICRHLGLVIAMARPCSGRGLALLDLIQEGNVGMLVALQKFDTRRGLRFSTYAAWWIRHYLQTAIATQVPIVRPPFRSQQRMDPTTWHDGCESSVVGGEGAPGVSSMPLPAIEMGGSLVTFLPLHDADMEDTLAAAGHCERDALHDITDRRDGHRLATLLHDMVAQLPARERDIIVARFGLDGRDECTLAQLGAERDVTRERVRQVQAAALQTLREALQRIGVTRDAVLG
jgi:RNA polymerase sigma factor (sigma-70 family)